MAVEPSAPSNYSRTLILAAAISLGSVLVLFPAWLPRDTSGSITLEDGAVEILQVALLSASAAFLLAASAHAGRFRPIYHGMSFAVIAAALAELENALSSILPGKAANWVILPFLVLAAGKFLANRRESLRFIGLASRHPASGFIAAALIIIYVFGRFFGSETFWQATLESDFDPDLPDICQGYLELLACYFIFVGVIGFCLPVTRRPQSPGSSES